MAGQGIEALKAASRGLRGAIAAELADTTTPQVSEATYSLLKFHGTYEQHDRDTATALKQAGQDKDWQFMVRVRIPAGRLTAAQYLALDHLASRHGNGTLRITASPSATCARRSPSSITPCSPPSPPAAMSRAT